MGSFGIILIVVLGLAIAVAAAILSHLANEKRRQELSALAAELGWSFDPSYDPSHDEEYDQFELFCRGHSRRAYNTLRGDMESENRSFPCKMGDFTYKITRSTGKSTSTQTYHLSYLIVHLPYRSTPDLLIRPEGLFDKLAGALGFDDIDFESAEFSRRFLVKSTDKRFAYDVIDPRMMEFLMASNPPAIDLEQGRCCLTDGQRRWTSDEFRARLDWSKSFFDQWPEHVKLALDGR